MKMENKYCIFRTYSSGVFAGELASKEYSQGHFICTVRKARRIHYWSGAASLSQLAEEGVKKPDECRFAMELTNDLELPNVIEIIPCTEAAKKNIAEVKVWKV
jgi:hypothetical protein